MVNLGKHHNGSATIQKEALAYLTHVLHSHPKSRPNLLSEAVARHQRAKSATRDGNISMEFLVTGNRDLEPPEKLSTFESSYTGTADPKNGVDCIHTIPGETGEEEKTKAIENADQRIKELTATIGSNTDKRKQLETDINNLKAKMAANTAGMEESTATREKELVEFN